MYHASKELKPKRWLVLAYCFNMDGQAASHHITDKIPYLKRHGIDPVVVSAATGYLDSGVEHHQVTSPAPSGLRFELRHILKLKFGTGIWGRFLRALAAIVLLPFYALEKIFLQFDSQWSWFITAERKGNRLIRERPFDLIYVSGGASSAFLAAHRLSKKHDIPWIAEIYDPMIHDSWRRSRMAYWWNARMEKLICTYAKAAFWYTPDAISQAKDRNPQLGNRGHLMRPGMMPPDFGEVKYVPDNKLKFSYFGGLTPERNLGILTAALGRLLKERPELKAVMQVHQYGGEMDKISQEGFKKLPDSILMSHGRLETDPVTGKNGRQRVLEQMRQSDVLILMHGQGEICQLYIPSKIYEYLWAQRPVLVFSPLPAHWNDILDSSDHYVIDQTDPVAIDKALSQLVADWEKGQLSDRPISQAHSVESAVELLFEQVCSLNPKSH
jgi:glycosyltransferase involved in cell wall biosynthesis